MNYTEKTKEIFAPLTWLNLSAFGELIGISRSNLRKYITGELEVSEKTYKKLMAGLEEIKKQLPQ